MKQSEAQAGVARNARCPCGNGKRYKDCHGAVTDGVAELTRRGMDAHQRGDVATAALEYRAALAVDAGAPHAAHYLGVIHMQRGEFAEAQALIERSLVQLPHEAEFHNNAGLLHAAMDRVDAAMAAYAKTLALQPAHATAWNNLGMAQTQCNDLTGAIASYRRALDINPQFAEARWNLALALLAAGNLAEGWAAYEARLALPALSGKEQHAPGPRYAGESLTGRTLLLTTEQGLGDTLQFIRFAEDFAARGARVIARVRAPLLRLCASAPGVAAVIAPDAPAPAVDYQLPLLSAGSVLALDARSVARPLPYLHADACLTAKWRALVDAQRSRLAVGLSWAGSPQHVNDRRRSCPLARLAPLLALAGIDWYSLQHVDGEEQIGGVAAARSLRQVDARHTFDDKAALMCSLDLVISVDTGNAHLAGALGVPLWVLLPYAADWRWGVATTTTPWYASATLFRQPAAGDWQQPVEAMRDALLAKSRGQP
ncbi:MAG: tetratricopeptide repeat protein [Casimicrobiaceae bacterium]